MKVCKCPITVCAEFITMERRWNWTWPRAICWASCQPMRDLWQWIKGIFIRSRSVANGFLHAQTQKFLQLICVMWIYPSRCYRNCVWLSLAERSLVILHVIRSGGSSQNHNSVLCMKFLQRYTTSASLHFLYYLMGHWLLLFFSPNLWCL